MSKEKFTPGEWRTEEHELSLLERGTVGFRIRTDSQIICAAYSSNLKDKPEMQANAHLIATAPEMLNELWRSDDLLRDALKFLPVNSGLYREIEKQLEENKKALKKARGEK